MLIILILENIEKHKEGKTSYNPITQREPALRSTYFSPFFFCIHSVNNIYFCAHIYVNIIERECLFLTLGKYYAYSFVSYF